MGSNLPRSTEVLSKLVSIPSVTGEEATVANFIESTLTALGYRVERIPVTAERWNLVATIGESEKFLAFYGHMDTVPPASDYPRDPFLLRVDGDIGRGLGAVDMKGGLACMLDVAGYAAAQQYPLKLIFGVDEEAISQGAHALVNSGVMKDVGFLVVGESGQVVDAGQDFSLCYGRKGRIAIEVQVTGKAAHAASASEGVNAIEHAAVLIQQLRTLAFQAHPRLGNTVAVVHSISANANSFSVPERCELRLSLLTAPGVRAEHFEEKLLAVGRQLGIALTVFAVPRPTPYGESYEVDRREPFLQKIEGEVFSKFRVDPMYTPSVADENVFANRLGIPVISLGPIGMGDHTAAEWVRISSLAQVVKAYEGILRCWVMHRQDG